MTRRRRLLTALLFLSPLLVLLGIFVFWPVVQAFRLSMTSWDGFSEPSWIGLENFRTMFGDDRFRETVGNNLQLLLIIPIWVMFPLIVAILIQNRVPGWRFFRLVFFVPALLSPVLIGIFLSMMLSADGPVNTLLRNVGLDGVARPWLGDYSAALWVLGAIMVWASFGIGALIFTAALGNVDPDLVDAASVDGASWFRVQRDVVFWAILPVIEFWTIIVVILSFTSTFAFVFTLTSGGPGYATNTFDYLIYEEAFRVGRPGYASAIGVFVFVLVLTLVTVQMVVFRRGREA